MGRLIVVGVLVLGGLAAWKIGETLSSDAISMGLGLLFGIFSGIPVALLVMAAGNRQTYVDESHRRREENRQPIILIVGGDQQPRLLTGDAQRQPSAMPAQASKYVDANDDW